jgi:hypothetical protein
LSFLAGLWAPQLAMTWVLPDAETLSFTGRNADSKPPQSQAVKEASHLIHTIELVLFRLLRRHRFFL